MEKVALLNWLCIVLLVLMLQGCSNEEEQALGTHEDTVVERNVVDFVEALEPVPDKKRAGL